MSKDFDRAKEAFIGGDPRKLAEFVRTNQLTAEQSEFVAKALAGEVKVQDGRSERFWTQNLYLDYIEIKIGGELREILFGKKQRVSKAEIFRRLADIHGYHEDAVKKAIARADQRRSGRYDLIEVFKRAQSQGRKMRMRFNWPKGVTELPIRERLEVLTNSNPERLLEIKLDRIPEFKERPETWTDAFISSFNKK